MLFEQSQVNGKAFSLTAPEGFPPTTLQTFHSSLLLSKVSGFSRSEHLRRNISDSHCLTDPPRRVSRDAAVQNFCVSLKIQVAEGPRVIPTNFCFWPIKLVPPIYSFALAACEALQLYFCSPVKGCFQRVRCLIPLDSPHREVQKYRTLGYVSLPGAAPSKLKVENSQC